VGGKKDEGAHQIIVHLLVLLVPIGRRLGGWVGLRGSGVTVAGSE
jgi:hypothetical protein